jgi:hypothetical protein
VTPRCRPLNRLDYSPPAPSRFLVPAGYGQTWGVEVALEMGDSYIGLEHALLSMIRRRETDHGTWISVITADHGTDPALTREVLNTALATLNRLWPVPRHDGTRRGGTRDRSG